MKAKILIVDDEPEQVSAFARILEQEGDEVVIAEDDLETLYLLDEFQPDLIILDIRFGREERMGLDILKEIREKDKTMPIIMLTGLADEGLDPLSYDLDADDFVSKSMPTKSLLARVKRCLRRVKRDPEEIDDRIKIYRAAKSVKKKTNGEWEEVPLEPKEYKILIKLVDNCGQVITREVLESFFPDAEDTANALYHCICELRNKLEPDPRNPQYILTKRGVGYWFKDYR
ncbi:MAG: response regulator transcription factor [Deltaproteobacteria bacterium]